MVLTEAINIVLIISAASGEDADSEGADPEELRNLTSRIEQIEESVFLTGRNGVYLYKPFPY